MNKELIERYLTDVCKIHPAEDRVKYNMLRDWILTVLRIEAYKKTKNPNQCIDLIQTTAERNITNALPGMDIEQRLEDIRRFCEEVGE